MLTDVMRTLWRKRVWVALVVVLAAVAGVVGFRAVPPTKQVTAQVLFLPPSYDPESGAQAPTAVNPFLSLGGPEEIVASLVATMIGSDATIESLRDDGFDAKYTVAPNLGNNAGPLVLVTVEDRSTSNAEATLDAVIDEIDTGLQSIQEEQKVPDRLFLRSLVVTKSTKPTTVRKVPIQVAVLSVAGTLALGLGLILLTQRGRSRKAQRTTAAPEPRGDRIDRRKKPRRPQSTRDDRSNRPLVRRDG